MIKLKMDWKIFQWSFVKSVASNDLSRIVGIVPLAGYLILFNDEVAKIITFNTIAGVDEDASSPFVLSSVTKLKLLFFGSLFVLVSYLFYRVFRPPILEGSNSDLEFSTRVRDAYSVYEVGSMEGEVYSDAWIARTPAFWLVLGKVRAKERRVSGYRPDARSSMFAKNGTTSTSSRVNGGRG